MNTTIPLERGIRDRLKTFGIKGEKYDTILERLMNLYERSQMTPAQIDELNPSEVYEATHVIACALEVLRGEILEVDR